MFTEGPAASYQLFLSVARSIHGARYTSYYRGLGEFSTLSHAVKSNLSSLTTSRVYATVILLLISVVRKRRSRRFSALTKYWILQSLRPM